MLPGTTYYYRGYATNAMGTAYSPDATFLTLPTEPITVTLTANPISMVLPTSSTRLTWTTTGNPDMCEASNYWSGAKSPVSGSLEDRTGMTAGTSFFTLTCKKAGTADVQSSTTVVVHPTITGICAPDTSSTVIGQPVIWTVTPAGGDGVYTYGWAGTEGLSGSDISTTISYT